MAALATLTLTQICDAVKDTLSSAVERAQSVGELSESMEDLPMLRVYPFFNEVDPSGVTDRSTFGGKGGVETTPVRWSSLVINADVPAQQRSDIGEDLAAVTTVWDATEALLATQNVKPYFGLEGIKAFSWNAQLTTFNWGAPLLPYLGVQFKLNIEVF